MPKVPVISQQSVAEVGIPNARLDPNAAPISAFGGGQALEQTSRALGRFNQTVQKIVAEEKKNALVTYGLDQDKIWADEYHKLVKGENGFLATKFGKNAAGIAHQYSSDLEAFYQEQLKTATSPEAKQVVQGIYSKNFSRGMNLAGTRQNEENIKLRTSGLNSFIKNETEYIADVYLNQEEAAKSFRKIEDQIREHAIFRGFDKETEERAVFEAHSNAHITVLERIANNGKASDAKNYLTENKKEIDKTKIDRIERVIRISTIKAESQRRSDEILAKAENMPAALEEAKKITDAETRDAVENRIKNSFALKKLSDAQVASDLYETAYDKVIAGGTIGGKGEGDLLATDVANLTSANEEKLRKIERQIRSGREFVTDWVFYDSILQRASSPELRDALLRVDTKTYREKLHNTEFKEISKLIAGLRKGDATALRAMDDYRTHKEIVTQGLIDMGLRITGEAGFNNREKISEFRRVVAKEQRRLQVITGKKATNKDIEDIVKGVSRTIIIDQPWWGSDEYRVFELDKKLTIEDVPREEVTTIQESLRRNNPRRPVTERAILDAWIRKITRKK